MINVTIVLTGTVSTWLAASAYVFVKSGPALGVAFMFLSALIAGLGLFLLAALYDPLVYTGRLHKR